MVATLLLLASSACAQCPMPKTVKVGGFHYTIEMRSEQQMPGLLGATNPDLLAIWILEGMPKDRERVVLLHELTHAVKDLGTREHKPLDDDEFLAVTTPMLLAVLRDNPRLRDYLFCGAPQ